MAPGRSMSAMRLTRPFAWWVPVFMWQLQLLDAKVQTGTLMIGGNVAGLRWKYLSKFGFGLGVGQYEVRLKLHGPTQLPSSIYLDFDIYLDEDWQRVQSLPPCKRESYSLSRKTLPLMLEASGEWGEWQLGAVEHRVRPHIWYFALSDCAMSLPHGLEVDFELRARQEDASEFSIEVRQMLAVHGATLLSYTIFLAIFASCCLQHWHAMGTMHPLIWVFAAGLGLQYTSQASYMAHLLRYRTDGVGYWVLRAVSENCSMASQVIHTGLLIIIARGYTLLASRTANLGIVKLVMSFVLITHFALVGLANWEDDAPHKHHENEGAIGWAIFGIRFGLLAWFLHAIRKSRNSAGLKVCAFLRQFEAAGATYLLAYPLLLIFVQAFAPYLRHPILRVGLLSVQLASDAWFARLFLLRGAYFEVSTFSAPLLPAFGTYKVA
eukprot:CAMPEP_0172728538 /NCGR_PEP_ID=MMETSP1074-20121228/92291_1 /TAXON_ID=2916 /ORGANISM="Ceratium fusus, Strain PA161109" /LENGTH=435 /DNA_ID=CAMNT_0013555799 /DNA_START=24 /DNA_END=1331 /DNA_ORIENTATION=+